MKIKNTSLSRVAGNLSVDFSLANLKNIKINTAQNYKTKYSAIKNSHRSKRNSMAKLIQ